MFMLRQNICMERSQTDTIWNNIPDNNTELSHEKFDLAPSNILQQDPSRWPNGCKLLRATQVLDCGQSLIFAKKIANFRSRARFTIFLAKIRDCPQSTQVLDDVASNLASVWPGPKPRFQIRVSLARHAVQTYVYQCVSSPTAFPGSLFPLETRLSPP